MNRALGSGRGWVRRAVNVAAGAGVLSGVLAGAGAVPASAVPASAVPAGAVAVPAGAVAVPASAAPVPLWVDVAAGLRFSCGIREGNSLWCWGAGEEGELGLGSNANATRPHQITWPTAGWTSVTAGYNHACAIRTGGALWCWGDNRDGAIGIGATVHEVTRPRQVSTPAAGGWASASGGYGDTCAIRDDATLWCWGQNYAGQLGVGNTRDQFRPRQITRPAADGWASVNVGPDHTCAVRADGTLWCWGDNWAGQLGLGSTSEQLRPQQVTSPAADGWASAAPGAGHTCAVRADSTLWCWGWNAFGQLGTGDETDQPEPQQVTSPAADGWTLAGSGGEHTCALRTHALWCWGDNLYGQLGIGGTTDQALPKRVPVPTRTGWSLVSLGDHHSCATHTGHTLWCWGEDVNGELGLGRRVDQHRPQQVTS